MNKVLNINNDLPNSDVDSVASLEANLEASSEDNFDLNNIIKANLISRVLAIKNQKFQIIKIKE